MGGGGKNGLMKAVSVLTAKPTDVKPVDGVQQNTASGTSSSGKSRPSVLNQRASGGVSMYRDKANLSKKTLLGQ